jgi:hypothetical protein
MPSRPSILAVACVFATLLTLSGAGCAKYEYDLVKPSELQRHIGKNTDAVVPIDPLEYRMRTVDNRLVVRVFNPTEDVIELVGPRCTVVDPSGQSHPLRTQSIAPGSFIKLIFPPPRPQMYDNGPTFGVGVGGGVRVDASRYRAYDPYWPGYGPRYLTVYDENDAYYWDWKDEGEVRAVLTFHRGEKEFRHELVFRRQKM